MPFRKRLREYLQKITEPIFATGNAILHKLRSNILLLIILIALIILTGSFVRNLFIVLAFYVLASISLFYNRWLKISLGFEFITFATVFMGILYGPVVGALVGFFSLTTAELITLRFTGSTIISLVAISFIGIISHNFASMDIRYAGILLAFIYDLIIIPLYILTGSHPLRSFLFMGTHLLWNGWLFFTIAPTLMQLLA